MKRLSLWAGMALLCLTAQAAADAPKEGAEKFTLRYKFQPGETVRWNVAHRTLVRTTVAGATQTAETNSASVKVWRVKEVKPDGSAIFEHLVESVDMRQQLAGCREVHYNSRTDQKPPPGFDDVAAAVGVPLSVIKLDPQGKILTRERKAVKAAVTAAGDITIPLPDGPVSVGHTWSSPHEVEVKANNGVIVRVRTVQKFTLQGVQNGVATIAVATQILTPIDDPALESQLLQCQSSGTAKFDVDAGRMLSQQMDLDKNVVGFRGGASSLHYVTRFSEELLPAKVETAARSASTVR